MANLLLLSGSRVWGSGFLEYCADTLRQFLEKSSVKTVLFVPYASTDHESYLEKMQEAFKDLRLGSEVRGIHEGENPVDEVLKAEAIFIGGGNTFLLLKTLYDLGLMEPIRNRILKDKRPYIGSSAGTNVATISISTTNDMPIVYPPSFKALGLVPFNINPHYMDPIPDSQHLGETREERIEQYLEMAECYDVLGLREGSALLVEGENATLVGDYPARLFPKNDDRAHEYPPKSDLSFLLSRC